MRQRPGTRAAAKATLTAAEVAAIPPAREGEVGPEFIDENGHMNILHYMELNARAIGHLLDLAGLDEAFRSAHAVGLFALEQHLTYSSELRLHDAFTVRPTIVDRSQRVVHAVSFVVDETRNVVANSLEQVVALVSREHRRATPFPQPVSQRLDVVMNRDAHVAWRGHACGRLGIKR